MQPATSWARRSRSCRRTGAPHQRLARTKLARTNRARINRATRHRDRGAARHAWTRRRGNGRAGAALLLREFRRQIRPWRNHRPGARLSGEIRLCGRAERSSASNRRRPSSGGRTRSRPQRRRRPWSRSSPYGSAWAGGPRSSRSWRRKLWHFRQTRWKGLARTRKDLPWLGWRGSRPGWRDGGFLAGRHEGRRKRRSPRQRRT